MECHKTSSTRTRSGWSKYRHEVISCKMEIAPSPPLTIWKRRVYPIRSAKHRGERSVNWATLNYTSWERFPKQFNAHRPLQCFARLCSNALVRLWAPLRPPALPHSWTPSASCSLTRLIGLSKPRFAPFENYQCTCLVQCQFGTPWRTRTVVLSSPIDTHAFARICTSQSSHRPQWPSRQRHRKRYLIPKIICRCVARILNNAYRAQQAAAPCAPILVFLTFVAGSCFLAIWTWALGPVRPSRKRRWEDASFKVGAEDWSYVGSSAHDMLVRASPLDQHGLWWDEKCVIATRLHSVLFPGCSSAVALLIYLVCTTGWPLFTAGAATNKTAVSFLFFFPQTDWVKIWRFFAHLVWP